MKRRRVVSVLAAGAVSIGLVSTGFTGAGAQPSVRGVTDNSIDVAGLIQAAQFAKSDVETGAKAAFDAAGPINGRKINYVETADDKGDANTDLSEARRLVQQDKVFAILPVLTPVLGQAAKLFEQQHVPFLGWGIAESWCDNSYGFAITGCIVPPGNIPNTGDTWGRLLDRYYKAKGESGSKGKTAAVVTEDNDTGKRGLEEIVFQAKKAGFKIVYQKSALPAPPAVIGDYSPYANDILTSNNGKAPDVAYVVVSGINVLGLAKALKDANYPGVITDAVSYDPRLVARASGEAVFAQFDLPESSKPGISKVVDDLKAAGATSITQPMLAAYFSADMFIRILKKVGKNLTPEAFSKAASKFTYQIKDTIGPTKYPKAFKQGAPCGTLVQSDGTKYDIAVPYGCYSNYNYKSGKKLKY